jgi:hypothetical protein
MARHSIYWLNRTEEDVVANACHDMVKRSYFKTTCKKHGGRGEPFMPRFQSFNWTIRFYDGTGEHLLAEYQYLSVKDEPFIAELSKEGTIYKIEIGTYPHDQSFKRPVYVIGHRCNDPEDIHKALENKANAVECDIWIDEDDVWWVDHDKFRTTKLSDWLREAKKVADSHGENFALIIFDIKTVRKLGLLKTAINSILPADLHVVYSVPDTVEAIAFDEIKNTLSAHEGFAIDYENSPGDVQRFFEEHEIRNGWYGNGINAAFPDSEDHRNELKTAGLMRNLDKTIKKTYIWTIELKETMGSYLYIADVDGMITNCGALFRPDFVYHAREIIDNSLVLRMATRKDNAFEVFEFRKPVAPVSKNKK